MPRFKDFDHNTPMLLPPDLRDWIENDHIVHFILDAVKLIDIDKFHVNYKNTGSEQYHPRMMLAMLIYSYATGRFHSRKIEAATYSDVAIRFICCNHHPDHDTICTFRRRNKLAFQTAFVKVLLMAQEMGHLKKIGTVSIDGSKFKANASKHSAVSYQRAEQLILRLQNEVNELTKKAEDADSTPLKDGLTIPDEIKRRESRIASLEKAKEVIEGHFKEKKKIEKAEYERKKDKRDKIRKDGKKPRGSEPKEPDPNAKPDPKSQHNFTDPESRIMVQGSNKNFEQCFNCQAAVDADGSMLIVGGEVTNECNDKKQLVPVLDNINSDIKQVSHVLADTGYFSQNAIDGLEKDGQLEILCAMKREKHGYTVSDLEEKEDPVPPPDDAPLSARMRHRLQTKEGKDKYKLRKQTVEPVFGIIKSVMGFREFTMRGLKKVNIEWDLLKLSYNVKKLFNLMNCTPVSTDCEKSAKSV